MSRTTRPRPLPILATAAVAAIAGVIAVGGLIALGAASGHTGEVAAITGFPATPTPEPTPSPTPTPTPAPTASPTPEPSPTEIPQLVPLPTPTPKAVLAMNLYRQGDFVSQVTKEQCMPAAMQIMLNIIRPKDNRTAAFQKQLDTLAQKLSHMANGGSEPRGWAAGLAQMGGGKYKVEVAPSRTKAILRAVTAMRATGRPVGLLVWRGAHSWVLHGYEATADPRSGKPFTVTHLYVSDPWYPRISSIWGPSRGPNARITPKQLEEDYLPWKRPTGRYPGMDGQFVLVIPVR